MRTDYARENTSSRRGNRRPVEYVKHPDIGEAVEGLRSHKTSGRCYRIDNNSRTYYKPNGLKGVAYLRRAVFEHLCWLNGREPDETETLIVTKPAFDMFGQEVGTIGTLDADGQAINVTHIRSHTIWAGRQYSIGCDPHNSLYTLRPVGWPELTSVRGLVLLGPCRTPRGLGQERHPLPAPGRGE